MSILVTGAAGFIGCNNVLALNERGITDIIAVDNLERGEKYQNLAKCSISDYFDKRDFIARVRDGSAPKPEAIFHQGACSDTMEHDGKYMMENNYRFIYASSAATYGAHQEFIEDVRYEGPLNVYGYSKYLFDQVLRRELKSLRAPVIGLRYFNVYGPNEQHKGRMASVAFHQYFQYRRTGKVKLFEGCLGYGNGEQSRDFVYVGDVCKVLMHFLDQRPARTRRQAAAHARRGRRDGRARVHRVPRSPQGQVPGLHAGQPREPAQGRLRRRVPHGSGGHPRVHAEPPRRLPERGRMMRKAAFLDRDGVINIDHAYVHKIEEFDWVPGVLEAARALSEAGYLLVVVTNQSGIGRGYYDEAAFTRLTDWMKARFAEAGAPVAGVYFCPHHPEKANPPYRMDCDCRKPRPGMLLKAAEDLGIDLSTSIMFGDKPGDMTAGRAAGCVERIQLGTDGLEAPVPSADATGAFRSLADAVASPWFAQLKQRSLP